MGPADHSAESGRQSKYIMNDLLLHVDDVVNVAGTAAVRVRLDLCKVDHSAEPEA